MSRTPQDLKPVYLIISEQKMLVEHAVNRLRERVAEVADLDFNSDVFDADTARADDIIAACNTLPFASERRLVVVRGIEGLNKEGLDALSAYAGDPSETTVLALAGKKLARNTRLYKAIDKLGGVIERKAPTKAQLPSTVRSMFADRGKEISPDAADLFVQFVGSDLQQISVEIDKAVAYVGERREVTRADIDETVATTAERSIFDFTDALAQRDCQRALRLAAELIGQGESEYGLHAMGVRMIRDLMSARAMIDRGSGDADSIARALGRQAWQVKKLPKQARAFAPGELAGLLEAAAATEEKMKTSRDSRLVLERWIVRVCAG